MILAGQPLLKRRIPNNYVILYTWTLFLHLMLVKNVGEIIVNQNSNDIHHLYFGLSE